MYVNHYVPYSENINNMEERGSYLQEFWRSHLLSSVTMTHTVR